MNKGLLTICKPSYNKADILIRDIKSYLDLKDDRLYVKINDNKSTDNTILELNKFSNSHLIFHVNDDNKGPGPNYLAALRGANTRYVMFLTDKDTVNLDVLKQFMDYLEMEEPIFGYVNLGCKEYSPAISIPEGVESVLKLAYLSKHPSGYFWRTDVLENALNQPYFNGLDPKFVFPFEIINGFVASMYSGTIVNMPLVITANDRGDKSKTASYNESNIFFGKEQLLLRYNVYAKGLMETSLDKESKSYILKILTKSFAYMITVTMRHLYQQDAKCYHYNLNKRVISFNEMIQNLNDLICKYSNIENRKNVYRWNTFFIRIKAIIIMSLVCVKELFIKPTQYPL